MSQKEITHDTTVSSKRSFNLVIELLSHSDDASIIYDLLELIERQVQWPRDKENITKLKNSGCLKHIIATLCSSDILVVNSSLNILQNCCKDCETAFNIVEKYNAMDILMQILQRYPKDDAMHRNVFRLICNMIKVESKLGDIILSSDNQLVIYIVQLLQKYTDSKTHTFSTTTIVQGIKVLRHLYNPQKGRIMVKNTTLLEVVGTLLITRFDNLLEKRKDIILTEIINFLVKYTKFIDEPCGMNKLRRTSKGDVLVYLIEMFPLEPTKIAQIILNLLKTTRLLERDPLTPKICRRFLELLKVIALKKDFTQEHKDYVGGLLKVFLYSLNDFYREDSMECKEFIPDLMIILDTFQDVSGTHGLESIQSIVKMLISLNINTSMIEEQLERNGVEIIIKKIKMIISSITMICWHQEERSKKFSSDFWILQKKLEPSLSQMNEMPVLNEHELDASANSSLGSSTSFLQEALDDCKHTDDSDDAEDCYSSKKKFEGLSFLKSSVKDSPVALIYEKTRIEQIKIKLIIKMLSLLQDYCKISKLVPLLLCNENLLMTLLKILCQSKESVITELENLTIRILSCPGSLASVMQTEFIPAVYWLAKSPFCYKCSKFKGYADCILSYFQKFVETPTGKEAIVYGLTNGTLNEQQQLALVIPYIKGNKPLLMDLLLDYDSLNILIRLLSNRQCGHSCFRSIRALAFNIYSELYPERVYVKKLKTSDYTVAADCENVVTLVLDDGTHFKVDRNYLSKKSKFFNSLLEGVFKESNETLVHLHEMSFKILNIVMYLLHLDLDMTKPKNVQLELEDLLEVITACDRYLLEDLYAFLLRCVSASVLNVHNVISIYEWSLDSNTNILRNESLTYSLLGYIKDCDVYNLFSSFLDSRYSEEFIHDVQSFMTNNLF